MDYKCKLVVSGIFTTMAITTILAADKNEQYYKTPTTITMTANGTRITCEAMIGAACKTRTQSAIIGAKNKHKTAPTKPYLFYKIVSIQRMGNRQQFTIDYLVRYPIIESQQQYHPLPASNQNNQNKTNSPLHINRFDQESDYIQIDMTYPKKRKSIEIDPQSQIKTFTKNGYIYISPTPPLKINFTIRRSK